jgi:hypothetical protein
LVEVGEAADPGLVLADAAVAEEDGGEIDRDDSVRLAAEGGPRASR